MSKSTGKENTLEKMPFKARGGRIIGSPFWLAGQYAKWTGQNADHKVRKKKAKAEIEKIISCHRSFSKMTDHK